MKDTTKLTGKLPPTPAEKILQPIQSFIKLETSGGILLMACTIIALAWANSPWAAAHSDLFKTPFTVGFGEFVLNKPLVLWINDGLMAIFFFLVGLEIKREIMMGELSSMRKAALPIAAAIGGMVVPALIYVAFNAGGDGAGGWGIPMATDIAFALGVLSMLGKRVPLALKIFLTALAIIDDIGAVLVIAFFYTAELSWTALGIGGAIFAVLVMLNRLGVRHTLVYLIPGIALWVAFLKSGVHATIAGILLAMTIPGRPRISGEQFISAGENILNAFRKFGKEHSGNQLTEDQQAAIHAMAVSCERAETPMHRLEHALHPWVIFFIVPVFVIANAGVALQNDFFAALSHPVSLGIIFGLFFGKQIGITLFSWVAVRSGLAELPASISWRQIYGASCLAGIGFTMSLFIAMLGFGESALLDVSKVGILAASLISGIAGWLALRSSKAVTE